MLARLLDVVMVAGLLEPQYFPIIEEFSLSPSVTVKKSEWHFEEPSKSNFSNLITI